ncbi:3-ketosphinganine reductase-like protein [Pleomassaria siparia CBS 279.74]|uniref:3-dehydrosphinganine reductase n=1 Tax=Pleomassaria siparia CBS 279.74 TaxID=1314801 RepID=A0A6G1JVB1_9PLEO|nr:3-ketosphinganine reductase-like protein [Pleomassaria siparia CBS 279.74]
MVPLEPGLHWATGLALVLTVTVSLQIMGFFSKADKFQVEGRTVLLTGGSYGMGKELAKLLSERGAHIILVARNLNKLQIALDYAKAAAKNPSTQRFHIISADVSIESENARVLAEATTWNRGTTPEIVWANAGSSVPGLFIETSLETMRKQMDLNYWAAAYLAQHTLKAWLYPTTPYQPRGKDAKSEGPRHFIITSSAVAFVNVAGYGPYGPAKTALRGLLDTLRSEVHLYNGARRSTTGTKQTPAPFDINIQGIYPGNISSPGHVEEDKTKHEVTKILEETDPIQTEVEAARSAIKGLDNGNYMTGTNWLGELMRISMLGGSPKNSIIKDTIGQWLTSIVWLFIGPDLESKVWGWGKKNGMPELTENKQ